MSPKYHVSCNACQHKAKGFPQRIFGYLQRYSGSHISSDNKCRCYDQCKFQVQMPGFIIIPGGKYSYWRQHDGKAGALGLMLAHANQKNQRRYDHYGAAKPDHSAENPGYEADSY